MGQPLPSRWVESLFARLAVTYGRDFVAQYDGLDLQAVKDDWAGKLADFWHKDGEGEPHAPAISWALQNLPPKPLNVEAFRQLCRGYRPIPDASQKRLDVPVGPPSERVRRAFARLAEPIEDERPQAVRIAQRYVLKFGSPGQKLAPYQHEWLAHSRRILGDWERAHPAPLYPQSETVQ